MASKKVIYTDLDTLFDTELALLDLIDIRLVREYYSNEYNIPNSYLYLNHNDFKTMFKTRNKDILIRASATAIDDVIRYFTSEMHMKRLDGSMVDTEIELIINSYPYKLDSDEVNELIEFYNKHILHLDNISIIYREDLPQSFVGGINIMIMRHGLDWFYGRKFIEPTFTSPNTRLFVPTRLANVDKLQHMDIELDKLLEYVTTTTMGDIVLEFLDDESFMIKLPDI